MSHRKETAADTWENDSIDSETFEALFDVLRAHPEYEVRPALQLKHNDSALVKTIETLFNAETTLTNLKRQVVFEEDPFDELTDRQTELLAGHDFATDTRDEVDDAE